MGRLADTVLMERLTATWQLSCLPTCRSIAGRRRRSVCLSWESRYRRQPRRRWARARSSGRGRSGGRIGEGVGHSRVLRRRCDAGTDEHAGHCGGQDGLPWVPRFCALRAGGGRGSSWLRADAGPCGLPLAPDRQCRRKDAFRVGLARGEVAGPRQESITRYDTVVLTKDTQVTSLAGKWPGQLGDCHHIGY